MDLSERGDGLLVRHPWETARARFLIGLLERRGLLAGQPRWLDVGAGDGWLTGELADASPAGAEFVCWDINYDPSLLSSLSDSHPEISFASEEPDSVFDRVLLLDVIEHVENDRAFLSHVIDDRLRSGGSALITVPAWQSLYSQHDVALSHHRRYSPKQARSVIWGAGLVVEAEGGLFHGLLLPRLAQVAGERFRRRPPTTGVGAWHGGPRVTRAVDTALRVDAGFSRRLSDRGILLPGLSYWALCTKP